MKNKFFKPLCVVGGLLFFLVACDKSSFKVREGGKDAGPVATDGGHVPTGEEVPSPEYPQPNPAGDDLNCFYQHQALASFSYIVYGADNLQLFWNPFKATGPHAVAYYVVYVKDKKTQKMFVSTPIQEKALADKSYHTLFLGPEVIGAGGQPMKNSFTLKHGESYWYDVVAYNHYDQPVNPNPRYIDITQSNYPRHHREAGFCEGSYLYDFYPGYKRH